MKPTKRVPNRIIKFASTAEMCRQLKRVKLPESGKLVWQESEGRIAVRVLESGRRKGKRRKAAKRITKRGTK